MAAGSTLWLRQSTGTPADRSLTPDRSDSQRTSQTAAAVASAPAGTCLVFGGKEAGRMTCQRFDAARASR